MPALVNEIADDSPGAIHRKKDLYQREPLKHLVAATETGLRPLDRCVLSAAATRRSQPSRRRDLPNSMAGNTIDGRLLRNGPRFSDLQPFFHWPLEFPEVFADGGFDAILSNPPWERIKLQEQEFFAVRDERIATAANKAARAKLIGKLPETNPALHTPVRRAPSRGRWSQQLHASRRAVSPDRTGRHQHVCCVRRALPATGELPRGASGVVLPTGIATDDTTKLLLRGSRLDTVAWSSLFGFFENRRDLSRPSTVVTRSALLTFGGSKQPASEAAVFVFIRDSGSGYPYSRRSSFSLSPEDISSF